MNGRKLQDRLYWGLGRSARHVGQSADAIRPNGPFNPMDPQNRFLRMPATFKSANGSDTKTNSYGEALWQGVFDGSYTRVGDYLVLAHGTYFVISQAPLLSIMCVRTNRTISISRPNPQTTTAANVYGGYTSNNSTILMSGWPASVLGETKTGVSANGLPSDQTSPTWAVLVPAPDGVFLSAGDIVTDDLSRTAVIAGAELTDLGWRISAKMATS